MSTALVDTARLAGFVHPPVISRGDHRRIPFCGKKMRKSGLNHEQVALAVSNEHTYPNSASVTTSPRLKFALVAFSTLAASALLGSEDRQPAAETIADAPATQLNAAESGGAGGELQGVVVTSNPAEVAERIRKADANNRDAVLKVVDANIEATEAVLARLRREGRDMKSAGRARFNEAYENVRARESELRQGIREVRHALPDVVTNAQAQLAGTYESYAQAVEQVEVVVRGVKTVSNN